MSNNLYHNERCLKTAGSCPGSPRFVQSPPTALCLRSCPGHPHAPQCSVECSQQHGQLRTLSCLSALDGPHWKHGVPLPLPIACTSLCCTSPAVPMERCSTLWRCLRDTHTHTHARLITSAGAHRTKGATCLSLCAPSANLRHATHVYWCKGGACAK